MKINKEMLENMQERISLVNDYYLARKTNSAYIKYAKNNPVRFMFDLWSKVYQSISYGDINPNVLHAIDGQRLFEQDDTFEMYPCNTNDSTLETALLYIYKKLDISGMTH